MDDLLGDLKNAFEESGYEIADVSRNRDKIRVVVPEAGAKAETLRSITYDVVPESEVLGLDVTTESVDGQEGVSTVVTFRHRP